MEENERIKDNPCVGPEQLCKNDGAISLREHSFEHGKLVDT